MDHQHISGLSLSEFEKTGPEYFRKKLSEEILGKRQIEGLEEFGVS